MPENQSYKLHTNKKGFSLIETLLSITILSLVVFMSYDFFKTGNEAIRFESEQNDAVMEARKAMNIMEKDIRMISASAVGSYPITTALPQELVVYSNIIEESGYITEQLRFFIDGTELKRTVTRFNTATYAYDLPSETTTVAKYLNNQTEPIFIYYDNEGNLSSEINNIRRISFSIKINVTPNIQPNDYYVESDVTLRNLKDNL